MKKSFIWTSIVLIMYAPLVFLGCKKTTTYNCQSGSCVETTEKGEFKTLSECQSKCSAPKTNGSSGSTGTSGSTCPAGYNQSISGSVEITAQVPTSWDGCQEAYIIEVFIYRKAEDRAAQNFVAIKKAIPCNSPVLFSGLCGGKYYYDVVRTYNKTKCGQTEHTPMIDNTKTALFEIKDATTLKLTCNQMQ